MTASISGVAVLAGCVRNGGDSGGGGPSGGEDDSGGSDDQTDVPVPEDEDCNVHDPENLEIEEHGDGWLVVDGSHQLVFFEDQEDAERTLEIIQAYGFDSHCFVERPDPGMNYWLVDGEPPAVGDADVEGEDCNTFDPDNLEIVEIDEGWRVDDGDHQILLFETEDAAEKALDVIDFYGFTRVCFVGRPDSPMMYMLTE